MTNNIKLFFTTKDEIKINLAEQHLNKQEIRTRIHQFNTDVGLNDDVIKVNDVYLSLEKEKYGVQFTPITLAVS